jgi:glycosyltransferase involved in cell wall biosynthesis
MKDAPKDLIKIITTPLQDNGQAWFRLTQWATYLRDHDLALVSHLSMKMPLNEMIELIGAHDVFFVRFISGDVRQLIEQVRRAHPQVAIVFDDDDDARNVSPFNESYDTWGLDEVQLPDGTILWQQGKAGFNKYRNRMQLVDYEGAAEMADIVTTTTKRLKASLERLNDAVAIIPNAVDFARYPDLPQLRANTTRIKLLWAGSASHYEDVMSIQPALKRVLEARPDIELHTVGTTFKGFTKDLPESQVIHHPWVPVEAHGFHLATIGAHIGLAPLVDNEFNRNKSALKWYEYTALGIPTIASNVAPYSDEIKHDTNGLLADATTFDKAIIALADDPIRRTALAQTAGDNVEDNNSIAVVAKLWLDVLQSVMVAKQASKIE